MHLSATLSCEKTPLQQVIATDITRLGCRVTLQQNISVGTFVTLAIPAFVELFGWVAWSGPHVAGIDFSHPLPPAVLEHVIRLGPC